VKHYPTTALIGASLAGLITLGGCTGNPTSARPPAAPSAPPASIIPPTAGLPRIGETNATTERLGADLKRAGFRFYEGRGSASEVRVDSGGDYVAYFNLPVCDTAGMDPTYTYFRVIRQSDGRVSVYASLTNHVMYHPPTAKEAKQYDICNPDVGYLYPKHAGGKS
jgi:hypothetical protein